jgi:hypothetical protein
MEDMDYFLQKCYDIVNIPKNMMIKDYNREMIFYSEIIYKRFIDRLR